jgi:hypothetical protein
MSSIRHCIATGLSLLALGVSPAAGAQPAPEGTPTPAAPASATAPPSPAPAAGDSPSTAPSVPLQGTAETPLPATTPGPAIDMRELTCTPACAVGSMCQNGTCIPTAPPAAIPAPAPAPPTRAFSQEMMGDQSFIPPWVHTSDFVDTRLTFLFADQDMLVAPGQTTPNSPGPGIVGSGNTSQYNQFYDSFNTKYTGYETLSNLVLYKKGDTFFRNLSYEAALALTLQVLSGNANPLSPSTSLQDASSYIRLKYTPEGWDAAREGITFTAFPMSADRFRLGYAYKISWGGSAIFPNQGSSVPGAKLQINKDTWYAFIGAKTTLIFDEFIHDQTTNYAVLAGAGWDILPELRIEANGGYFQQGVNPEPQVLGLPVDSRGISAEAVYHVGQPIGYSVDFALYQNDPNQYVNFFRPESYPGGLSYTISLEGTFLQQILANPDVSGATEIQNASAAAFQAKLKYDKLRINITALFRTLSFIQFNVPGFPPFYAFPAESTENPEMFISAGADYYFPWLHLTTGIIGGVDRPASFTTNNQLGGNNPPVDLTGNRTVVVTDVNTFDVLPTGDTATLVYSVKGTFRLQISEVVAAIGELYFTLNNNQTTFKEDAQGVSEPSFQKPEILGFNLLLQARF